MHGPRTNTSVCRQGSISRSTEALISKEIIKRFIVATLFPSASLNSHCPLALQSLPQQLVFRQIYGGQGS